MSRVRGEHLDDPLRGGRAPPASFFEEACHTFRTSARAAGGSLDYYYSIGGRNLRLRFAGPALVPCITPALEHLATGAHSSNELTVLLWDSVSTGTVMSPPPWPLDAYRARGEIRGYQDGSLRACVSTAPTVLNMLNRDAGLALFWIADAGQVPYYERVAPLRIILHWWLSGADRQFAHAAAVGGPDGGVILVGGAGAGKSTTALACLDSPLSYASDDYCLLVAEPAPHVFSVYNSAKLEPGSTSRLPHLKFSTLDGDDFHGEKAFIYLSEFFPGKMIGGFPIRAILLPTIREGGTETKLEPTSAISALRALAPSTMYQLPGGADPALRVMARLVNEVRCYDLVLGSNLGAIPAVISRLLDGS